MRKPIMGPVAAVMVALAGAAGAQDAAEAEVRERLRLAYAAHSELEAEAGHRLQILGGTFADLPQGAGQPVRLPVERGQTYVLIAACEAACADLDLTFADPNGQSLAADRNPDADAYLYVEIFREGPHLATLVMADCAQESCRAGLLLTRRQSVE